MQANDFWPALVAHREASWDALRAKGRVVKGDRTYHLTRREDVVAALCNTEVFSSAQNNGMGRLRPTPTAFDPPEHGRYREILQPWLTPKVVQELVPEMTALAEELVERVVESGRCEFRIDVAVPYVAICLCGVCGLPSKDAGDLWEWKHGVMCEPPGSPAYRAAAEKLFPYFAAAIGEHRRNPELTGVFQSIARADLTDEEVLLMCFTAVGGAGDNEAVVAISAFAALACDPELRQQLRADPDQTALFVNEVLRLEPPVSGLNRVTTRAVTVGDVTIPAGAHVALRLGAINRESCPNARQTPFTASSKKTRPHWTFGAGPHRCPAAHLARTELAVLINAWLARIPDFEIQPGSQPSMHDIVASVGGAYQIPTLPLRWQPAVSSNRRTAGN